MGSVDGSQVVFWDRGRCWYCTNNPHIPVRVCHHGDVLDLQEELLASVRLVRPPGPPVFHGRLLPLLRAAQVEARHRVSEAPLVDLQRQAAVALDQLEQRLRQGRRHRRPLVLTDEGMAGLLGLGLGRCTLRAFRAQQHRPVDAIAAAAAAAFPLPEPLACGGGATFAFAPFATERCWPAGGTLHCLATCAHRFCR
eukprot:CAMPEP_0206614028 /NCGR_PEP_ID=MMETSP0325_2-20121206/57098_1 /ASSEMBLY_ACC=CAM_ASM_000347 /TAXON_ID=2866 /ORGANISM="Crypthecodinium cohnii, Strain Seligo" /LENGTH=195 /DNA_ID=CAMNT_0054134347 /DNA_START=116 /DNA_END=701 /DNA_ORIENTATION=+